MRSLISFKLPRAGALGVLAALGGDDVPGGRPDVLLSGGSGGAAELAELSRTPGGSEGFGFLAGLDVDDELAVTRVTTDAEIAAFAFADERPSLGFCSYGFGLARHGVASRHGRGFPLGHFKKYRVYLHYRETTGELRVLGSEDADLARVRRAVALALRGAAPRPRAGGRLGPAEPSLGRDEYVAAVEAALERIQGGYSYQLNLSIRFEAAAEGLDPFALFLELAQSHPAAHYAYFETGDLALVSTSPERFIRVRDGEVLSQPIKGTRVLPETGGGVDAALDELTTSAKEDAELSMIVDLIRNDVSAHCEYGSVRVAGHKSVFAVDNLLQMYTSVLGRLRPESTALELFLDALPGGSVTGCPKKESLRIIDELEPHGRDIYCGSFVVLYDERSLDSSVAIRTAWLDKARSRLSFCAGSGIVVDSVPAWEYEETVAKAGKFLALLESPGGVRVGQADRHGENEE